MPVGGCQLEALLSYLLSGVLIQLTKFGVNRFIVRSVAADAVVGNGRHYKYYAQVCSMFLFFLQTRSRDFAQGTRTQDNLKF